SCTSKVVFEGRGIRRHGSWSYRAQRNPCDRKDVTVSIAPVGTPFRSELPADTPHCRFHAASTWTSRTDSVPAARARHPLILLHRGSLPACRVESGATSQRVRPEADALSRNASTRPPRGWRLRASRRSARAESHGDPRHARGRGECPPCCPP